MTSHTRHEHPSTNTHLFTEIKQAEAEAQKILAKADAEAESIIHESKEKAAALLSKGLDKIEEETSAHIMQTREDAAKEAEIRAEATKDAIKKLKQKAQKKTSAAKQLIIKKFNDLC